jgi:CrcB protein
MNVAQGQAPTPCGSAYTILAGGGVGTYTTFSTWMLESHRAGEDGDARALWANIAVSLVAGLAAVALGHRIGGLL